MPPVKANRINVKKLVYAEVLTDTTVETTYGEVKAVAPAMQIQLTPAVSTGTLYGDGVKQEVVSKLTGLTTVLDINKLPINVRADWYGHKYENGTIIVNKDDVPKTIALGYMVEQTKKVNEYVWLYKGTPQPYAATVQQATDSINFSTDSITIEFVVRDSDGDLYKFADSADSEFTEAMAEAWFEEVGGGTPTP